MCIQKFKKDKREEITELVQYLKNEICIWALITFKFYALTRLGIPFEEVFVLIFADAQKLKLQSNSKTK